MPELLRAGKHGGFHAAAVCGYRDADADLAALRHHPEPSGCDGGRGADHRHIGPGHCGGGSHPDPADCPGGYPDRADLNRKPADDSGRGIAAYHGAGSGAIKCHPGPDCGPARHHYGDCGVYRGGDPQIINAGIQLLTSLVSALPEIITAIVAAIPQIIDGLVTAILGSIPQIIDAGVNLLISLIQNLPTIITTIVGAIPQIISSLVNAILNSIPQIIQAGVQLFVSLIQNLPTIIVEIVKAVPQIIAGIVNAFTSSMGQIVNIGKNIVQGLWQGIQSLAGWIWDKVSGWISGIWDGICSFFGINSPSKEMAWVGEMLGRGLAGGIEDSAGEAVSAAEDLNNGILGVMNGLAADMQSAVPSNFAFDAGGTIRSASGGMNSGGASFGTLITIQQMIVRSEDDIRRISQELYNLMQVGSRAQGRIITA